MDINTARKYVRKWREDENLDPLTISEEIEQAATYLKEKGGDLPPFIIDGSDTLNLKDGVYSTDNEPLVQLTQNKVLEIGVRKHEIQVPTWDALSLLPLWYEKQSCFVKMTGDVTINPDKSLTYWVTKVGEEGHRHWGAKGGDLVESKHSPEGEVATEELYINRAAWTEIKNHLTTNFVPSFPWKSTEESTSSQVRESMLSLVKAKNNGIATTMQLERDSRPFG